MVVVAQEKIDRYTNQGWWGQHTLWDLFVDHCQQRPQATAVVDAANRSDFAYEHKQSLTWLSLSQAVNALSWHLLQRGLNRDDVVVAQMPNCVEQFVVYLACAKLGLIVSPVPIQFRENELHTILKITQAKAVVTFASLRQKERQLDSQGMWLALQSEHTHLKNTIVWGDQQDQHIQIKDMLKGVSDQQLQAIDLAHKNANITANDVFTICWTSGTEAQPKGVPRSHNEWLVVAPSIIEAGNLKPFARLLNPFPLINMAGFSTGFAAWLVLGGTVIQHHPFQLDVFLHQLRTEQIDYTVCAPAILNTLLQNEHLLEGIDFQRLSRIGSGSAPLSDWMVRGFEEKYGVRIVNYFGSNEGAALTASDIDVPDPQWRAAYFPRAGVEGFDWKISTTKKIKTRLVDLLTEEEIVESGKTGELRFEGPTIFSGYFGAPEMTATAFDDQGFYKTGDLFQIAGPKHQYYQFVGRSKDLIIRGGMKISSEEVENLLLACPGVKEAAVVAVPDQIMGEKICACIATDDEQNVSLKSINDHLKNQKHIAIFKLPEYLMFVTTLPRNPVGKILKRDLREQARLKFIS